MKTLGRADLHGYTYVYTLCVPLTHSEVYASNLERKADEWSKQVLENMRILQIDGVAQLQRMSSRELEGRVRDWEKMQWQEEMEGMSTLRLYRNFKKEIQEERMYDNTFESVLLFRARANCLKLGWRKRFEGKSVECDMCGEPEETLEHFIGVCKALEEVREQHGVQGVAVEEVLLLTGGRSVNGMKRYIKELWSRRDYLLKNGLNNLGR